MVKLDYNLLPAYVFLAGIILASLMGIWTTIASPNTFFFVILIILGIIIGYINADDKKSTKTFLIASSSLVIVSGLGNNTLVFIGGISPVLLTLKNIVRMILVLFVPATIIAALKVVFSRVKI